MSNHSKPFGAETMARVVACMSDGVARTAREIEAITGIRDTGACGVMRHLEANGQAFILDWPATPSGKPAARWQIGQGKSAARPAAKKHLSGHQWRLMQEARAREEPDPWKDTFKPFRDPLTAAFFGEYRGRAI